MDSNQMKNYMIVALVTALLVIGVVWLRDSASGDSDSLAAGAVVADSSAGITDLTFKNNYVKGDEDAPVTIYEFSDFQCPFCGRFYTETLPLIEEQYIKTGKVKLIYKDFPLDSIHPEATPAALAARCAGGQGKFWEYHDKIFENQQLLSSASYLGWAGEIGLDTAEFSECFTSREHLTKIRQDLLEGQNAGIRGTPGFVVNGQSISGAQPFSVFQQVIEAALR